MGDRYYKSTEQIFTLDRSFKLHPIHEDSSRIFTYIFDFEFKTLAILSNAEYRGLSTEKTEILPFSAVDEMLLHKMHAKLVSLGGKPDPLPQGPDPKPLLPVPPALRGPSLEKKP